MPVGQSCTRAAGSDQGTKDMGKKSTWESEGKPRSSTRRASGARKNSCTRPESNRIEARAGCIDRSMAEQTNKRKPSTHGTGFKSVSPRNILVDPWGFIFAFVGYISSSSGLNPTDPSLRPRASFFLLLSIIAFGRLDRAHGRTSPAFSRPLNPWHSSTDPQPELIGRLDPRVIQGFNNPPTPQPTPPHTDHPKPSKQHEPPRGLGRRRR